MKFINRYKAKRYFKKYQDKKLIETLMELIDEYVDNIMILEQMIVSLKEDNQSILNEIEINPKKE